MTASAQLWIRGWWFVAKTSLKHFKSTGVISFCFSCKRGATNNFQLQTSIRKTQHLKVKQSRCMWCLIKCGSFSRWHSHKQTLCFSWSTGVYFIAKYCISGSVFKNHYFESPAKPALSCYGHHTVWWVSSSLNLNSCPLLFFLRLASFRSVMHPNAFIANVCFSIEVRCLKYSQKTDRYIQLHFKGPQSPSLQCNHNKIKHTPWSFSIACAAHPKYLKIFASYLNLFITQIS